MIKVFISYTHEAGDAKLAEVLCDDLSAPDRQIFFDRFIPPGLVFDEYIRERLSDCDAFLLLASRAAHESKWVRAELRLAHELSDTNGGRPRILVLLLEDFARTWRMEWRAILDELNYIACYDRERDYPQALAAIRQELEAMGRRAGSPSDPAGPAVVEGTGGPRPQASPVAVVPQGLRSFSAADSDFFLELLPGPRDRDGLPESIRFWKYRIEETREPTFAVGVVYGPSGCGKSSLMKAGLLPRLARNIRTIYVEATADETEARVRARLKKALPDLPVGLDLTRCLAALRQGQVPGMEHDGKVLIVLDQFEQWLHAHRSESNTALARALRQCDGERLQCLLMVRDDFWMALTRFLGDVHVELSQGQNAAAVDLFDLIHARHVLTAFGQAFGRLPEDDQDAFLDQAIAGLAQDGRVISIRLALFAEMIKGRPWTPATLKAAGGMEGIGVGFLEETFRSPALRVQQKAAQAVLEALLPEHGTDIKGHMRSFEDLRAAAVAAGDRSSDAEFAGLLKTLDREFRLITPTDPAGLETGTAVAVGQYYQLTHDYVVPSLREWLTRELRKTRRGRARLRLAERAALWSVRPENRFLPSAWEWCRIRTLTRPRDWTEPQRRMMGTAARVHGIRALGLLVILLATTTVGLVIQGRDVEERAKRDAAGLVQRLFDADTPGVPAIVADMKDHRRWVDPVLRQRLPQLPAGSRAKLHASLALLPNEEQVEFLYGELLRAGPAELPVLRDFLKPYRNRLNPRLWSVLESAGPDDARLLPAAAALADYDPAGAGWETAGVKAAAAVAAVNPVYLGSWMNALRPVRAALNGPLAAICRDGARRESEQTQATNILADYAADDARLIAELLADAEPMAFATLFRVAQRRAGEVVPILRAEIGRARVPTWKDAPLPASWTAPDPALGGRLEAAHGVLAERFAFCQTLPLEEGLALAEALRPAGYRPTRFRPYRDGQGVRVAALWTRDGRDWRLQAGLTAAEVTQRDTELRSQDFIPADVAGYQAVSGEGAGENRHAALWAERASPEDDARLYVAASRDDHKKVQDALKAEGYIPRTIQSLLGGDGQPRSSGVWGRSESAPPWQMSWDQFESRYEHNVRDQMDSVLFDIDLSLAAVPRDPRAQAARDLEAAGAAAQAKPTELAPRLNRARANLRLGEELKALGDLNLIIEKFPKSALAYGYRARAHAGLHERAAALDDLGRYQERTPSDSSKLCLEVAVTAALGEETEAVKRLEALVASHPEHPGELYNAACAYALAAQALAGGDVARGKVYAARALDVLRAAIGRGYADFERIEVDADLDSLWADQGFRELLRAGNRARRYGAIWQPSAAFTVVESHGLDPAGHAEQAGQWIAEGYRPVALAVAALAPGQPPVTASSWQRPVVSDEVKDAQARRQARAAIALLRLGQAGTMWPLLRHSADPAVRSYLVNWLKPLGVDPAILARELAANHFPMPEQARGGWGGGLPTPRSGAARASPPQPQPPLPFMDAVLFHPDISVRRALILALGQYEPDAFSPDEREPLVAHLLDAYRDDPDAGVHGAADWTLRRWNQGEKLQAVTLPAFNERGDRRWYVNSVGQTMALVEGPVEFTMGSPLPEPDRFDGETRHRRRISRRFALATREVTVDQYQRARKEDATIARIKNDRFSPEAIGPMNQTLWYHAAAYCNWLSRQEGLEPCYAPNSKGVYAEGMTCVAGFLDRTGYRLPTEAEWEYACRAGAVSSHYHGGSVALLERYAWYVQNSHDRTWPCGQLQPNDLGLFDMLGNVIEWCQDPYSAYPAAGSGVVDDNIEAPLIVTGRYARVLRGGSFTLHAASVRAANRLKYVPSYRYTTVGFRPARTYR
jgi:formylglycine-generating enzyme required for sulfatase activity